MFFWFVGTAVLGVWSVFRDPRFDYRLLIVGVLAPDVIDGIWGGARAFHSVVTIVGVLVLVMVVTAGRRPIRRRLLAIPIGSFVHLIVDFAFADTNTFWWPVTGLSFDGVRLPVVERGWLNLLLEIFGLALCAIVWKRFGLADTSRRRRFVADGLLEEV
ncbi:MAG: hypothetical protein ACO31G_04155 [Ilumatobacteraceae bacterium]